MAEATYFTGVLASAAGASKRHLALFNAAGSGKRLKVSSIKVAGSPTAAVTGQVVALHGVRITSAPTGGSGGTIVKADPADASVPAQVTVTLAATGGAAEEGAPFGVASVSGEETASANGDELYRSYLDGTKTLICDEGQGILVKQGALAAAGAVSIVVSFSLV